MNKEDFDSGMKHKGFKVPDGYFEHFEDKVVQKLPVKKGGFMVPIMKKMSIAAALILASGLAVFFYNQNKSESFNIANARISESDYIEFQNTIDLNDDEFSEVVSTQFIDSLYKAEVLSVNLKSSQAIKEMEEIEAGYSPLDEIEI